MSENITLTDYANQDEIRPEIEKESREREFKNLLKEFIQIDRVSTEQLKAQEYHKVALNYFTIRILEGIDKAEAFLSDYLNLEKDQEGE